MNLYRKIGKTSLAVLVKFTFSLIYSIHRYTIDGRFLLQLERSLKDINIYSAECLVKRVNRIHINAQTNPWDLRSLTLVLKGEFKNK